MGLVVSERAAPWNVTLIISPNMPALSMADMQVPQHVTYVASLGLRAGWASFGIEPRMGHDAHTLKVLVM